MAGKLLCNLFFLQFVELTDTFLEKYKNKLKLRTVVDILKFNCFVIYTFFVQYKLPRYINDIHVFF